MLKDEEADHEQDADLLSRRSDQHGVIASTPQARSRAILELAQRELAHRTRACELLLATSDLLQQICGLAPCARAH